MVDNDVDCSGTPRDACVNKAADATLDVAVTGARTLCDPGDVGEFELLDFWISSSEPRDGGREFCLEGARDGFLDECLDTSLDDKIARS